MPMKFIEVEDGELKELRRDARRYRWLRSEEIATSPHYYSFWKEFDVKLCREEKMDALIDATMEGDAAARRL